MARPWPRGGPTELSWSFKAIRLSLPDSRFESWAIVESTVGHIFGHRCWLLKLVKPKIPQLVQLWSPNLGRQSRANRGPMVQLWQLTEIRTWEQVLWLVKNLDPSGCREWFQKVKNGMSFTSKTKNVAESRKYTKMRNWKNYWIKIRFFKFSNTSFGLWKFTEIFNNQICHQFPDFMIFVQCPDFSQNCRISSFWL